MALVLKDRVVETTNVSGTGTVTFLGPQDGFQAFSSVGNGNTTYYTIEDPVSFDWEVGIGTYNSNTLTRDTVFSSSNGGALVYFGSGTKNIFLDLPSEVVNLNPGDVFGPASAINNNFASFNLTTGKLIKDSGFSSVSFATAAQGAKADTAVQPGDLGTAAYLDAGSALGVATLDAGGKVPVSQIPALGDLNYQGTWNATTNSPTLTSSAGTKGFYYVVNVAGTTNLNGITDWQIGDWAVFNGSVWQKIDNTDAVTSVNGYTGTVVLTYTDVGAQVAGTYVNSVSGTAPVVSSGGTTPAISMAKATGSVDGYLSSTDWTTFNSKGTGNVVGPSSATDNAITRYDTTTGKLIQNSTVTIDDNGNIDQANAITFDITPATLPTTPGTLYWDNADGNQTLSLVMEGNHATQQIGEEMYYRIKASSAITEGQVVMFTGTVGASGGLTGAPATGLTASTASYVMGVATQDIPLNDWGYITQFGLVRQINTTGGAESWVDGQILYLNPSVAGGLTKTLPTAPNPKVQVCAVVYAASNGSLFIRPTFGGELGQYEGDVGFSSVAAGNLIRRNAGNTAWENVTTIPNTNLANSSITINGSAVSLGGSVSVGTVTSVTGTAPVVSSGGATPAISMAAATTSVSGYLTSTDWNTFNGKAPATSGSSILYGNGSGGFSNVTVGSGLSFAAGTLTASGSGTVTSVSVVSANGFAGTVATATTTPAITLTTSISGLLKGNATAISAATSGTDYSAGTSALGTGILKSTTSTGALTIAVAGDFPTLNQNTSGSAGSVTNSITFDSAGTGAVSGTTYNGGTAQTISYNTIGAYAATNPSGYIALGSAITGYTVGTNTALAATDTLLAGLGKIQGQINARGTGNGTVTSVGGTGTVSGISLSGTVTTTGNLTLGGTLSLVSPGAIGSTTASTGAFTTLTATGSVTAFFSDDRLKTRHGKIENALDKLQTLDGFYYTPNQVAQDLGYEATKDVGVSAQSVQAIMPEVVAPAPIDSQYLTVRYEKLVPLLIEAIKELKAEVDELKKAR